MTTELSDLPLDQQHIVHRVVARMSPDFAGTFGPENGGSPASVS